MTGTRAQSSASIIERCTHDFTERETAVIADGYCPLCMAARLVSADAEIERLTMQVDALNRALCKSGDERARLANEIERLREVLDFMEKRALRRRLEIERLLAESDTIPDGFEG
jgi:hypothetical protein